MEKCSIKVLAMGLGIAWGIYMLCLGWVSVTGWGAAGLAEFPIFMLVLNLVLSAASSADFGGLPTKHSAAL